MMERIGLNGATLPGRDLLTKIRAATAAGFALYEPRVPELLAFDTPEGRVEVGRAMAEGGLGWLPLNALEGVFAAGGVALDSARTILPLAARFGVSQVIAVPAPPVGGLGRSAAMAELRELVSRAETEGVRLLYELIGFPHYAFPRLELAAELAGAVGLPLVLDTFHLAVSETALEEIASLDAEQIGLVHLSDAIVGDRPVTTITDDDRVLPGEGDLSLSNMIDAIGRTGFGGPISVEVFHPKYAQEETNEVAQRALSGARRLTKTWHGDR
jgi:4-hydroxyphenylpyruvate dioxygenase